MTVEMEIKSKEIEIEKTEKKVNETLEKLKVEKKLLSSAVTLSKVHVDSSAKKAALEQVKLANQKVSDFKLKLEFVLFDLKDLLDALFKLHLGRIKYSYEAIHGKSPRDNLIDYENYDDLHDELQDLKTKVYNLDSLIAEKANNRDKQKLKRQSLKKTASQTEIIEFEKKIEGFENAVNDLLLEYRDVAPKYKAAFVAYWEKELNSPKNMIAKRTKSSLFTDFNSSADVMDVANTKLGKNLSGLYLANGRSSVNKRNSNQSLNSVPQIPGFQEEDHTLDAPLVLDNSNKPKSLVNMVRGLKRRISRRSSPKQSENNLAASSLSSEDVPVNNSNIEIMVDQDGAPNFAVFENTGHLPQSSVAIVCAEPEDDENLYVSESAATAINSNDNQDLLLLKEKCSILSSDLLMNGVDKMYLEMADQLAEAKAENKKLTMQLKRRFSKSESTHSMGNLENTVNGNGATIMGDWKAKYDEMKAKYDMLSEEKAGMVAQHQMQSKSQTEEIQEMTNEMLSLVRVHKEMETNSAQMLKKLEQVESALAVSQEKGENLMARVKFTEEECLKLISEKDSLAATLGSKSGEELKAQEEMQNQLVLLEKSIEMLNDQVINLKREKQEALKNGESRFSEVKAKLDKVQLDFSESSIELINHKDTAESLELQLKECLDRETVLKNRIETLLSQMGESSQSASKAFQDEIDSLNHSLVKGEEEFEAVKKQRDALQIEVTALKKSMLQVPVLEESVVAAKGKVNEVESSLAAKILENEQLFVDLKRSQSEIVSLYAKLDNLAAEFASLKKYGADVKNADAQRIKVLQDQLVSLESTLAALEEERKRAAQVHAVEAKAWREKENAILQDFKQQQQAVLKSAGEGATVSAREEAKLKELLERNTYLTDTLCQKEQQLADYKKRYQSEVNNVELLKKILDEVTDTSVTWPAVDTSAWSWNSLWGTAVGTSSSVSIASATASVSAAGERQPSRNVLSMEPLK